MAKWPTNTQCPSHVKQRKVLKPISLGNQGFADVCVLGNRVGDVLKLWLLSLPGTSDAAGLGRGQDTCGWARIPGGRWRKGAPLCPISRVFLSSRLSGSSAWRVTLTLWASVSSSVNSGKTTPAPCVHGKIQWNSRIHAHCGRQQYLNNNKKYINK